jgi:O-antigen ligase
VGAAAPGRARDEAGNKLMRVPSCERVLFAGLLLFGLSLPLSKSAGNILIFLLYLAAGAGVLHDRDFRDRIRRTGRQPLTAAFACIFFVALAGVLNSENLAEGLQVATKFLSLPIIYVLVAGLIQSSRGEDARTRSAEHLLFSFLAGLLVLNALGLMTFIGLIGDREFLVPLVPLHLHHIWYSNINALGFYTAAALMLYSPRVRSLRGRVYLSLFMLLSALCILLSLSRTAWFSLALTLAVLAFSTFRNRKEILAAGVAALLAGALAYQFVPLIHDRIDLIASEIALFSAGEQYTSIGNRILMWKAALTMFVAHPLLGVGTGDYVTTMTAYIQSGLFPEFLREFNQPHNMYLFALATNGIFGLAALLFIMYRSVRFAAPLLRTAGSQRLFGFLALAAAVHFSIAGLTESLFNIQIVRFSFVFIMGVCVRDSVNPAWRTPRGSGAAGSTVRAGSAPPVRN